MQDLNNGKGGVLGFVKCFRTESSNLRLRAEKSADLQIHGHNMNAVESILDKFPEILKAASFTRSTALLIVGATFIALGAVFLMSTIEDGPGGGGTSDDAESTSIPTTDSAPSEP